MEKEKFSVFGERVLIKPDDPETTSAGGIIIPISAQGKTYWGKVVGVGSKVEYELRVDDHVYYEKYSGTEVKIGEDTFVIVKQEDILGKEVKE